MKCKYYRKEEPPESRCRMDSTVRACVEEKYGLECKVKINPKNYKKYIKLLKKDISKGVGIPKKVLFGDIKHIKKYDKKLLKRVKKDD